MAVIKRGIGFTPTEKSSGSYSGVADHFEFFGAEKATEHPFRGHGILIGPATSPGARHVHGR
jgi:hypothetical protein